MITENQQAPLEIDGEASLDGLLTVVIDGGFEPTPGSTYPILTADSIGGQFANPHGEVVASDGSRFTIRYSKTSVTLTGK